jgi:hypothetical protein
VVESAYGQGNPPPELLTAWACQRWNCLPETGAYFDQDYTLIKRMTAFSNIYNLLAKWQTLSGKQVHSLTDGERKILRWLKDLGIMFQ